MAWRSSCRASTREEHEPSDPLPRSGWSRRLVLVGRRDYFPAVAARVGEIEAAAAGSLVGLAVVSAVVLGPVRNAVRLQTADDLVELGLGDFERVVQPWKRISGRE